MSRLILLFTLFTFCQFSGCNFDCGIDSSSKSIGSCRDLTSNLKKTQIAGFGACGTVTNSRLIEITCSKNSGTNGACTNRSNGSGYFVVLAPNNSNGKFIDTNFSTAQGNGPITDCNSLWNAINSSPGLGPSDLVGIYHGDPANNDFVTCTDTGGCKATPTNCFSGFDYINAQASGVTASIPNGNYLACAFIDSPYLDGSAPQGIPPISASPAGIISSSASNAFTSITVVNPTTAAIAFDQWVDY